MKQIFKWERNVRKKKKRKSKELWVDGVEENLYGERI